MALKFDAFGLLLLGGGALGIYLLNKDKETTAKVGGLPTSAECEKLIANLPEPFRSVIASPSTDFSNAATIEAFAKQLDAAGLKKEARCIRAFKDDIIAEAKGGAVNCEDLIGSATFLTETQKGIMRSAIATGSPASREDIQLIAKTVRGAGTAEAFKLADCLDAIALTKPKSALTASFVTALAEAFTPDLSSGTVTEESTSFIPSTIFGA